MIPDKPNPASAAARTGSGDAICLSSSSAADVRIDSPPRPNPQTENRASVTCAALRRPQTMGARRHLHLVPQQPRPRRIDVRISVADGRAPIARSRLFKLSDRNLQELIDHATQMERRP